MKLRLGDVVKIISVDNCDDYDIIRTKGKVGRIMQIDGECTDEAYFVEFSIKEDDGYWYAAEDLEIVEQNKTSIADLDKCESVAKLINEVKGLSTRIRLLESGVAELAAAELERRELKCSSQKK